MKELVATIGVPNDECHFMPASQTCTVYTSQPSRLQLFKDNLRVYNDLRP